MLIALGVLVVLPTGIDDPVTTVPLFLLLGWKGYLLIFLIVGALYYVNHKKVNKLLRLK